MGLSRNIRDVRRVSAVVEVFFKHGLGYFIGKTELMTHLPLMKKALRYKFLKPSRPEVRLRHAFEELGGSFIKLGQLMSIRPDLVPKCYRDELKNLQDSVPSFPYSQVKAQVEKELGGKISDYFSSFSIKPIAAASVGQVHVARLKKEKNKVVVKVQRPDISETMQCDIDLMYYVAKQIDRHGRRFPMLLTPVVEEFERYTKNELNFILEAKNAERFAKNFQGVKSIKVPDVYWKYTTHRVLTLEYIAGTKLEDIDKPGARFDRHRIIDNALKAIVKQVFEDGFFHADMHPGNIIVLDNSDIAFIDFGIVGNLPKKLRKEAIKMFISLTNKDTEGVLSGLLAIGELTKDTDLDRLREDIQDTIAAWHGSPLHEKSISEVLINLLEMCSRENLVMPIDIMLWGKAFVTVEGTCFGIYPEFNLVEDAKPYLEKALGREIDMMPGFMQNAVLKTTALKNNLDSMRKDMQNLLRRVSTTGTIGIDIEEKDVRTLSLEIDRSSNRLTYGMLIAAFVLSGSIIISTGLQPTIRTYPVLSLICFGLAGIVCIMLFVSIVQENKLLRMRK